MIVGAVPISFSNFRADMPAPLEQHLLAGLGASAQCFSVTVDERVCLALHAALSIYSIEPEDDAELDALAREYLPVGDKRRMQRHELCLVGKDAGMRHMKHTISAFHAFNALTQVIVRSSVATPKLDRLAQQFLAWCLYAAPNASATHFDPAECPVVDGQHLPPLDELLDSAAACLVGTPFVDLDLRLTQNRLCVMAQAQSCVVLESYESPFGLVAYRLASPLADKWGRLLKDHDPTSSVGMQEVLAETLKVYNGLPTIPLALPQSVLAIATSAMPIPVIEPSTSIFIRGLSYYMASMLLLVNQMRDNETQFYAGLCDRLRATLIARIGAAVAPFVDRDAQPFTHYVSMAKVYKACRDLTVAIIRAYWEACFLSASIHLVPATLSSLLTTIGDAPYARDQVPLHLVEAMDRERTVMEAGRRAVLQEADEPPCPPKFALIGQNTGKTHFSADAPLLQIPGFLAAIKSDIGENPADVCGTIGGLFRDYQLLCSLTKPGVIDNVANELADVIGMHPRNLPAQGEGDDAAHVPEQAQFVPESAPTSTGLSADAPAESDVK